MTATASDEDLKTEISAMRVKELKQELESYGISTKSFFEKGEMVAAVLKARKEGKTPTDTGANGETASTNSDASSSRSGSASTASTKIVGIFARPNARKRWPQRPLA